MIKNDELYHYGTPHDGNIPHSGRYEYGSGEGDKKSVRSWNEKVEVLEQRDRLKAEGLNDNQIAARMGLSVEDYRLKRSIANAEIYAARQTRARRLRDHGYSLREIAVKMGEKNESTVRGLLKASEETRKSKIDNTTELLESKLKNGEILDIGPGTEINLGVTRHTLDAAIKNLKEKGYVTDVLPIKQPFDPSKNTNISYIAPTGTSKKDVWEKRDEISLIKEVSHDNGIAFTKYENPTDISDDRVAIQYKDDGGIERDGLVGIRPGLEDITLGNSAYAQVRIGVAGNDGKRYYIKGMAVYDPNVPEGKDIVVYSNKNNRYADKANKVEGALKECKSDPANPFGAVVTASGQTYYKDKKGEFVKEGDVYRKANEGDTLERYSLSPVNKIREEGEWNQYSKSLSAQFLSKQKPELIRMQLDMTYKDKNDQMQDILELNNPLIKKKMLDEFASKCDHDALTLKASAFPRQSTKVLIPIPSLKDNEIYAPTFKNGETVVLVRYPHAGTFEIPKLVVNNNVPEGKTILGNAIDAVGINRSAAEKLSGADFDGDTALIIPTSDKIKITTRGTLKGLEDFDPSEAYPGYSGMKTIGSQQKQREMGKVTNLITDMTIQNPSDDELARAVRHSMVIIDAEKHNLNWKQSEKDNCIEALKMKYQKNPDNAKGYGGASSLITRAKSTERLPEREMSTPDGKKRSYTADPETGKIFWRETGREYAIPIKDPETEKIIGWKREKAVKQYHKMDLVYDAHELSNGSEVEDIYADYANQMKAMANKCRKISLSTKAPKRDPQASKIFAKEVSELEANLNIALKNKPLERKAMAKANRKISLLCQEHPEILLKENKDKYKKEKSRIVNESRLEVGAGKHLITITDRQWDAIQAHALSPTKLQQILDNCDTEVIKKLATPKERVTISPAKQSRIKAMNAQGVPLSEIAEAVGVSVSTVAEYK